MKILLFGATGMIGQGVLRECLLAPDVDSVMTVGRSATGESDPKLEELVHPDLFDYGPVEARLQGFDACFFCLGTSAAGATEAEYARLNYELPLAAGTALSRLNPDMVFVYVSGATADSTEAGRIMWARVKGRTENALSRLPFKAAYAFRPGLIYALHGEQSKTTGYRILYTALGPVLWVMRRCFPNVGLTTEQIGRAMLAVARDGASKRVLEVPDIREAAGRFGASAEN
jgi:uncharacterized protein YbjT (DUF2867 family)